MSKKMKSNATVLLIKNALKTVVRIMPDEEEFREKGEAYPDLEKLKESAGKPENLEELKETLEVWGIDYRELLKRNSVDLTENGAKDRQVPLSMIRELGTPLPDSLTSLFPERAKKSMSVYLYSDKYFVLSDRWKSKRIVTESFAEAVSLAGYADEEWFEKAKIKIESDKDTHFGDEARAYMDKVASELSGREKSIKYIVIEGLGETGFEDETGIAMAASLYVKDNEICRVTSGPESVFAVNSAVTKEEFEKSMIINGVDEESVIYFLETGKKVKEELHTAPEEKKELSIVEKLLDDEIFIGKHTRDYLDATHGGCFDSDKDILLYGIEREGLVFMEEDDAKELAELKQFMNDPKNTWGDLKKAYSDIYYEVMENYPDEDDYDDEEEYQEACEDNPRPDDSEMIDEMCLPGFSEGEFYDWPARDMLSLLPSELHYEPYGKIQSTWINGDYLELYTSMEREIIEFLEEDGYTVIKDEDVMDWACA